MADIALLTADPSRFPTVWQAFRQGLHDAQAEPALDPEPPTDVITVVVAATPDQAVVGGVLLRERTATPWRTDPPHVAAAIAERLPEGVNEASCCWVHPARRCTGLGLALVREIVHVAAGHGRWTLALANRSGLSLGVRAGFVPDDRFRDLPHSDGVSHGTLCWYDHHQPA